MPNVTITVPEELKDKMDKYSEVSWSEICRNAISQYIAQRENPTPRIELYITSPRLCDYDYEIGYPTLTLDFKILNRMNSKITVDRILTTTFAVKPDGKQIGFGSANDLRRKTIEPNSTGFATVDIPLTKEKLKELQNKFKISVDCKVKCTVFVDGFEHAYEQEIPFLIPLAVLNDIANKALGTHHDAL